MDQFFIYFTNIRQERDRSIVLHIVWSSFLNIGIILAVFNVVGNVLDENDMLAIMTIGLLNTF